MVIFAVLWSTIWCSPPGVHSKSPGTNFRVKRSYRVILAVHIKCSVSWLRRAGETFILIIISASRQWSGGMAHEKEEARASHRCAGLGDRVLRLHGLDTCSGGDAWHQNTHPSPGMTPMACVCLLEQIGSRKWVFLDHSTLPGSCSVCAWYSCQWPLRPQKPQCPAMETCPAPPGAPDFHLTVFLSCFHDHAKSIKNFAPARVVRCPAREHGPSLPSRVRMFDSEKAPAPYFML